VESDAVWQVGCVLLSLVCGKSPFLRESLKKTMGAIGKCDADLSGADALKETCEGILEFMKSAKNLNEFEAKLDVTKCVCSKDLFEAVKNGCEEHCREYIG